VSVIIGWALTGPLIEPGNMLVSLCPTVLILLGRVLVAVRPPSRGSRAALVFVAGNLLLALASSLLNPFMCIYVFSSYPDVERLVTGSFRVPATIATGLVIAVGQAGGIPGASATPWLFPLLALVNIGIAFLMLTLSRERERQVRIREEAAERLAKANAANLALHEELMTQARQMGIDQERARLSREIHDTVAQGLIGVIRQLEALPSSLDDPAQERVRRAEQVARDCLTEARRAVQALAPRQLDDDPLADALHEIIKGWGRVNRIVTELDADDAPATSPHDGVLVRVAQESLANIARHSDASQVWVCLDGTPAGPRIRITDDGVGFTPVFAAGHGLSGMRDRLAEIGGSLRVDSAPGKGCTVTAVVPS
jgi:integral membrane sensor signal transduction histidine kinase